MILAAAKNTKSYDWHNKGFSWEGLVDHLQKNITQTPETLEQYQAMDVETRGKVKDVGGVIAGALIKGATRRKGEYIDYADVLIFDADTAQADLLTKVEASGYSFMAYTTRSHKPEEPRWRLLFPLSRSVTPEEYRTVICRTAEDFGTENFCGCSYKATQVMFYGSYSLDAPPPTFRHFTGKNVDVDLQLSRQVNWELFKGKVIIGEGGKRLGDPREIDGIIGAFCRMYSVTQCLQTFLHEVYEPTDDPTRWAKIGGTTPGLIIYDDLWAFSHHAEHDVCADGHCHNAFNLLKMHKHYGDFLACVTWIREKLPQVATEDAKAVFENLQANMGADVAKHGPWTAMLERNDAGLIMRTPINCMIIMDHDETLINSVKHNVLLDTIDVVQDLPWRKYAEYPHWSDSDRLQLDCYLSMNYCQFFVRDIDVAFNRLIERNRYNPLLDKLNGFVWDGTKRIDDLFIRLFGTPDTELTRIITRKFFAAAIQRAYSPGIKFDCMLMLIGPQGIQKSRTVQKLSLGYYIDTVSIADLEEGKRAQEKIQGAWLCELGELVGMRKADKEALKNFLSSAKDTFRPAYGRYVVHKSRLTLFIGTSNKSEQLTDETGNRRYWIIDCPKFVSELTENDVGALWAEAKATLMNEPLYLDTATEALAEAAREPYMEQDPQESLIREWLKIPIPCGWYEKPLLERMNFKGTAEPFELRKRISAQEIWVEYQGKEIREMAAPDKRRIGCLLRKISGANGLSWIVPGYGACKIKTYNLKKEDL